MKNFSGTLLFDEENQQMIRVLGGKEEGFLHPGLQSQWHQFLLKDWLNQHKFPQTPIKSFIVISNPSTIIKFLSGNPNRNILHAAQVPYKLDSISNRFKQDIMDLKDVKRFTSMLLKKHTDLQENILPQYELSPQDLLTGVHCPSCFTFTMIRSRMGVWHCDACSFACQHGHVESLKDYALLVKPHITKEEMVRFLHLSSSKVSRTIIYKERFYRKGNNKRTSYDLSSIF